MIRTITSWTRPAPRLMRTRSPSRTSLFGLACSPLTSTLPPSHARLASERVLKRHATSSQTSRRMLSLTGRSDENFHLALGPQRFHERLGFAFPVLVLEELLDARPHFFQGHGARGLLLGDANDVVAELRFDEVARRPRFQAEGGVVERSDHLALGEETKIAAVDSTARVLRVLTSKRREVLARLDILQNLLRFGFGLRLRRRVGVF